MPQLFSPSATLLVRLAVLAAVFGIVAISAVLAQRAAAPARAGVAVEQPIPFSHKHHVGDVGLDCRYCHTSVETARTAGMPSSAICLSCHSQLFKDAPMLAPLHASVESGTPISWQRVHDLPVFVYFDHSIHVTKGVACVSCHGRVDQMPVMMRNQPLDMSWCIECHRAPERRVGRPDQVFSMQPEPISESEIQQLLAIFNLEKKTRMTDCSTCHR